MRRRELLLLVIACAGCGLLPPDEPAKPKPQVDPDLAAVAHTWKVADHVLANKTNLSERDAADQRGRTVTVGAASYATPWHGTCDEANREKRTRTLGDVAKDADLSETARTSVKTFGLADSVLEFRLSCQAHKTRTPQLTIYVHADHAMTCFSGACYLLKR